MKVCSLNQKRVDVKVAVWLMRAWRSSGWQAASLQMEDPGTLNASVSSLHNILNGDGVRVSSVGFWGVLGRAKAVNGVLRERDRAACRRL